jgi:hypothetical protein
MTTAGELIKQLQEYPEDMPVLLIHFEPSDESVYVTHPDVEDYHSFHQDEKGHIHKLYHLDERETNFKAIVIE